MMTTKSWFLCGCVALSLAVSPAVAADPEVPEMKTMYQSEAVLLQPSASFRAYSITVMGPGGIQYALQFDGDQMPYVDLLDHEGTPLPDGHYHYQLSAAPILSDTQKQELLELRAQGSDREIVGFPRGITHSGSFTILDGQIVEPVFEEEHTTAHAEIDGLKADDVGEPVTDADANRDQVFADDLVVQGSICTGFDCVNGESFGADTIRLKENNLRIHFDDTSSSGSFPANDWRITVNDQSNGGSSYLSIDDVTGSKVPFKVTAGAATNSFFMASNGNVGMGTATPVLDLHLMNGNTPAMRFEQDASSGFSAQTWDIAANEANFFVRDVTSGSLLPFRIQPGAPTSSIHILNSGNVGLGTASATQKLHVEGGALITGAAQVNGAAQFNGNTLVNGATLHVDNDAVDATAVSFQVDNKGSNFANTLLQNTSTTAGTRLLLELKNKGMAKLRLNNTDVASWSMGTDSAAGDFILFDDSANKADLSFTRTGALKVRNGSDVATMTLDANGNLTIKGTLTQNGTPKRDLEKDQEIADLKQKVSSLEARLAALEKLLQK